RIPLRGQDQVPNGRDFGIRSIRDIRADQRADLADLVEVPALCSRGGVPLLGRHGGGPERKRHAACELRGHLGVQHGFPHRKMPDREVYGSSISLLSRLAIGGPLRNYLERAPSFLSGQRSPRWSR